MGNATIIGSGIGSTGGGGVPPSICSNMTVNVQDTTVKLRWQDPNDTVIDKQYISSWAGTKIVKKLGTYPKNEDDGILVIDNNVRNQYFKTDYVDTIESGENWKYSAFPYNTNGLYCYNTKNNFNPAVIYEVCIDPSESNPNSAVTYPAGCLNENFTPMSIVSSGGFNYGSWENVWFMNEIYPCMVKYDGTEDYKLNKNNFALKEDGSSSDVANASYGGNCMIRFPQIWYKWVMDGTKYHLYLANVKVDDSYNCFTHINQNGQLVDSIYIMAFQPSQISGKARSLSGKAITVNTTGTTEISMAQANGSGWDLWNYGQWLMLQMLTILTTKSLDTQSKLGRGRDSNNANNTSGECIQNGMFYGTTATGKMKAWGIENLFANYWKRANGCCYNNGLLIKLGYGTTDGSTVNSYNTTGSGYVNYGVASGTSGGYISAVTMNNKGIFPKTASGSATTFYCDGYWWTNGGFAKLGGSYANGLLGGLFAVSVDTAVSYANANIGGSLSYIPF